MLPFCLGPVAVGSDPMISLLRNFLSNAIAFDLSLLKLLLFCVVSAQQKDGQMKARFTDELTPTEFMLIKVMNKWPRESTASLQGLHAKLEGNWGSGQGLTL